MVYSKNDIAAISQGGFFGAGNAQLPAAEMLMIDQIEQLSQEGGTYGKGFLEASFRIHPSQWFFDCHFKGDPVMPGCLGIDALWQLVGIFLGHAGLPGKGRALGVDQVRFSGQIYPDADMISYRIDIKKLISRPMAIAVADGQVIHKGEVIYRASGLRVGLIDAHIK